MKRIPAVSPCCAVELFGLTALIATGCSAGQIAVEFPRAKVAYVVAAPSSALEKRVTGSLCTYLSSVTGRKAALRTSLSDVPKGRPAIILVNDRIGPPIAIKPVAKHPESFALSTGMHSGRKVVVAAGTTDLGLKRAVQRLVITSRQETDALVVPAANISESPWIPFREWTICPWQPGNVRGHFFNPYADQRMNIYTYGDQRLSDYVDMYDWFGFSGVQLMETAYGYKAFGSIQDAQAFQKRVARSARENGQQVSVWTWSAEFSFGGWDDPEAVYEPAPGKTAWDDSRVHRTFDKYYDIYADLAPYADRFILHFFDPGRLKNHSDLFKYAKLLESKLKARNPGIQMAIDNWAQTPEYLVELCNNGFSDYLLLPVAFPQIYPGDAREKLHEQARKLGMRLGIWGWYTTEYETDQLASMYVNAKLLKSFYNQVRRGAYRKQPVTYWSEMEATHLVNIFSMYSAARLLWDPGLDPHSILAELTDCIWGPTNGPKVLKAVELVQDVRTGPNWESYWWTLPTHRVGTDDPAADSRRAAECIAELKAMKPDEAFVPKFPLPYPPGVFVELVLPHLEQIRLFAEFRLRTDAVKAAAARQTPKRDLEAMLAEVWQPVPRFSTWVGTFGSKEIRQQKAIIAEMRKSLGLNVRDPEWLRLLEATEAVQMFRNQQRASGDPVDFTPGSCAEFFWSEEDRRDRLEKAVEVGLMTRIGESVYQLADWRNWSAEPGSRAY